MTISVEVPNGDTVEFSLGDNETISFEPGWLVCSGKHTISIRGR